MKTEEEIMKNKASIKMNDVRIKALIKLLSKEGVLTHQEVEEEVENIINKKGMEVSDEEPE